ncbi:MAG TPA: methionine--tRNA ligase [Candidatus Gastranaerophilaceae bacterium]|nr:methionine--tRNA ligase [Candidatus Gastranaerophilaceae bacterium]HPT41869.1 methionine--tRNA ligase [Candidatus Gastranaerophilaceae bacterium]
MEKFYLTTAIDYVNGAPHIGHAYEKILTDVIARHFSQRCDDVYFLTGTDEHGIKIQKTAAAKGISPQQMCDEHFAKFQQAWKVLEVNYSQIIRTTDDNHKKIVQQIFKKLYEQGDIYKHSYQGLYCSGCESFLNEKDLIGGKCPVHNVEPELVSEENYFFKLTKYKDAIIKHIKENPDFIVPAFRANEVLNQLENIEDISVSRSKENVSWGIDVLDDSTQIIYVWIDALSNYITALGYDVEKPCDTFKKYWPADVQVIGKDILKFHAIYWPAILLALDLELPKHLFVHGFININQEKMSKSLGNVISPVEIMKNWELQTPDALRYYLATAAPFGKDGNFSDEDFKEKVNADLANNMGNLLNRTLSMLVKYFEGGVNVLWNSDKCPIKPLETVEKVKKLFDNFEIQEAANEIISLVDLTNKYVAENAPWSLAKEEKWDECGQVLTNVLEIMCVVCVLIYPFCPNIAQDMANQLKFDLKTKLDDLNLNNIKQGKLIEKEDIKPVFLRLDSEFATNKGKM